MDIEKGLLERINEILRSILSTRLHYWTKLSANSGFHSLKCLFPMAILHTIYFEFQQIFYIDQAQIIRATIYENINI